MIYLKTDEFLCFEGEESFVIFIDKEFTKKSEKMKHKIELFNNKMTLFFSEEIENNLLDNKNFINQQIILVHIQDNNKSEILKLNLKINN